MAKINKARFWTGVLYPENMKENWKDSIGDTLQYPYAYCQHSQDKDSKSEHRKDHVHLIVAFPNTTTYKHALDVMDQLSAEGKKAINTCEAVIGIRNVYDYLIHDTEDCRKQGKEQYDPSERITGNNFDIGAYEQLGAAEKNEIFLELGEVICKQGFTNYMDFYAYVVDTYDDMNYIEVLRSYSSHFDRLTRGNYHRWELEQGCYQKRPSRGRVAESVAESVAGSAESVAESAESVAESVAGSTENTLEIEPICCPYCGSVSVKKCGKTLANSQRWRCKDCGKTFI